MEIAQGKQAEAQAPSAKMPTPTARAQCGVSSQTPVQERQTKRPRTTSGGDQKPPAALEQQQRARPARRAARGADLKPRWTRRRDRAVLDASALPQNPRPNIRKHISSCAARAGSRALRPHLGPNHMGVLAAKGRLARSAAAAAAHAYLPQPRRNFVQSDQFLVAPARTHEGVFGAADQHFGRRAAANYRCRPEPRHRRRPT